MSESADASRAAMGSLAECRDAIEALDLRLVALLAERVELGRQTARFKLAAGQPLLDPAREAAVIRRAVAAARDLALPVEPVREIFWQIVGMSRRAQEGAQ